MRLSPSAHIDTFCRDNLPPAGQWPELTCTLPELAYPARLNCAVELLDATAAARGASRPCLLSAGSAGSTDRTWSYGDLIAAAGQAARVLTEDLGLVPGNRVLLRGPNNPWLVACWFAVLRAGGVAVTTMPLLRAGELATICQMARIRLALCDHRFTGELAAANVPGLVTVTYGGTGPADLVARAAGKPAGYPAADTAADDVAIIAFTSGTTGRPKATMHFHRDLLAIADTFSAKVLKPRASDVFTGTPPLAFTFGLGGLVVFPLRAGAATLLVEKATPAQLADHIAARGVTVCSTAPTAYRAMIAAGKAGQLRGLRLPVSAGEHLPAATWQAFYDATGVKIIDGIGSTEMLHIFISAAGDDIRPGATGKAVPGYQAAVLGEDGRPVPDGQPGRLAVKGPTGCRYLAGDRQRTYVSGGWNLTGDTAVRDGEGYFWYQARSDDMIISAGYNISGPQVEEALLTHPDVAECGVVGVPDADRGQIVKAYVVLREPATAVPAVPAVPARAAELAAKAAELQDFVKRQIAPYKYPRAVEFVSALPRTATGKLQRFRLRETGQPAGTGPAGTGPASTGPAGTGPAGTGPVTTGRPPRPR